MMWSLSLLVLLWGTCAYGGMYPGYGDSMMMMMGGYGDRGSSYDDEPVLLNCFARFLDENGNLANELTVNIEAKDSNSASMTPYDVYGYGSGSGKKLSARIQLSSNVNGPGQAFVVFTERAREDGGCSNDNFGDILIDDDNDRKEHGFGGVGLGGGLGLGAAYGLAGYGLGMGGYGGYGLGGGYGYGYGMGHGYGHHSGDFYSKDEPDKGVVTVLNFTPGALTTAVVDDVGFDDLRDLAGRGVLICSDITYDWDWKPQCSEPFFSCCALKYDNVALTLVGP